MEGAVRGDPLDVLRELAPKWAEDFVRIITLLNAEKIRYCVIGGHAIAAYVEPCVGLPLSIVVASEDLERSRVLLAGFRTEMTVDLANDRQSLVARATESTMLGIKVRVAALDDVLQQRLNEACEPARRETERRLATFDIARIVESYPHLRERVPPPLR